MARVNPVHGGFRYIGSAYGLNAVQNPIPKQVATTYGTAIFIGDPIKKVNDGTVSISAAGEAVYGIVVGCHYLTTAGKYVDANYIPASIAYTPDRYRTIVDVIVATPFTLFEVDADDATTMTSISVARAFVDENCDHIATAAGDTGTGLSGYKLDISDHKTGSAQWRIHDLGDVYGSGGDVTAINFKVRVIANETHNLPGTFSTTGI